MADQIAIKLPFWEWNENSAFTATVAFRTLATGAADVPDSVKYKIRCETTGTTVKDWTTVSPAASVSISITADDNAIQAAANRRETKTLLIKSDVGLSNQHIGTASWTVRNLAGV